MYRFNRDSRIVCHCDSPEEAITFINYCNDHFIEPGKSVDAHSFARSMFIFPRGIPNDCVRYSPCDFSGDNIGYCTKEYYIKKEFHVYEFSEPSFSGFDDREIFVDSASMTSFLDSL